MEIKSKSKTSTVKLEDLPVRTDYEWLSSGKEPLPACGWESFQIHWMRNFPNIFIIPKGIDILTYFLFYFAFIQNKVKLDIEMNNTKYNSYTTNNFYKKEGKYKGFDQLYELAE